MKDFLKIMYETNRFIPTHWNRSEYKYHFANGSYIEFFSVDQESKVRGARRHILYVNEANSIKFETYYQLAIRTSQSIWIDYNPSAEFWAHTELKPDPDSDFIILTYKDNEALSPEIVKEIEKAKERGKTSKYWNNWWRVYGLGQVGSIQGVILSDWESIDKIPEEAVYVGSGMDFGFTNDPTVLIDVFKIDGKYIFDEVIYETGLLNQDIAKRCKSFKRIIGVREVEVRRIINADLAEPKSIREIANFGVQIRGADKGKDSIIFGLNLLQSKHLLITSRSLNIIRELRAYVWDTDKSGTQINVPIKHNDHCADAMRYWAVMTIGLIGKADIR